MRPKHLIDVCIESDEKDSVKDLGDKCFCNEI